MVPIPASPSPTPDTPGSRRPWWLLGLAALLLGSPAWGQLALVRQGKESRAAQEVGDGFGFALASGDFDGDGYMDVASGAPFEKLGGNVEESGAVIVSFGGPYGLSWERAELLYPTDQFLVADDDVAWFGYALAAGDVNGDGIDDLFVGAPQLDWNGVVDQGGVYQYLGGAGTIGTLEGQVPLVYDQGLFGAAQEGGDMFGAALFAGELNGDGFIDLLIGGPGENLAAGAVYGGYGSAGSLVPDSTLTIAGFEAGADDFPNDGFGTSVLIADVVRGPEADLIVGAPFEDNSTNTPDAGTVYVIPMGPSGPSLGATIAYTANEWGIAGQPNARFGLALAAGDFRLDTDASLDLAIGAPGNSNAEGNVFLLDGDPITPLEVDVIDQFRSNDNDGVFTDGENVEAGDEFGFSLVACDHDGDGMDDLAVGSPGEDIDDVEGVLRTDAGLVTILYGDAIGLGFSLRDDNYSELDLNTNPLGGSRTGEALACGDNDDDRGENVFVGAPEWNVATGHYFDIAPWRQVYGMIANSAIGGGCEEDVYYALRPFDQERTASTGKIMTTLLACEASQLPAGDPDRVPLSTSYPIPAWLEEAFEVTGCSNAGYEEGEIVTFETLIRHTMMVSGNDSSFGIANLLADNIVVWSGSETTAPLFAAEMNARAALIGMVDTNFENPSGVDTTNQWSTAYDMFLLTVEAMKNPLFEDFAGTTTYDYDRLVPDPGGGLIDLQTTTTYGWLMQMQALVPQAIAGKPGSTSIRSRVTVARQTESPWGLAYGLTYGAPAQVQGASSGAQSNKDNAAVLQLALALCDPTITLADFPQPSDLSQPVTVDDVPVPASGDTACAQFEVHTVRVVNQNDAIGTADYSIDCAPVTSSTSYAITAFLESDLIIECDPLVVYEGGLVEFESHGGIRFGNPDLAKTLSLNISVDQPVFTTYDVVLQPEESFEIPAASIATIDAIKWTVQTVETETRLVQVEESYSSGHKISTANPSVRLQHESPVSQVRHTSEVCVEATSDPGALTELAITLLDPDDPYTWDDCQADRNPYGAGLAGAIGVPVLLSDADPVLGTTIEVTLGNSTTGTAPALLLVGPAPFSLPVRGGTLLVLFDTVLPYSVPAAGLTLSNALSSDLSLCGQEVYGQLVLLDAAAPQGFSFSRGLRLEYGL